VAIKQGYCGCSESARFRCVGDQQSAPSRLENPGRVRVQWEKDGKAVNPVIKTSELFVYHDVSSLDS